MFVKKLLATKGRVINLEDVIKKYTLDVICGKNSFIHIYETCKLRKKSVVHSRRCVENMS